MDSKVLKLYSLSNNKTIRYAAEELAKYIYKISPKIKAEIEYREEYEEINSAGIWLGLTDKFQTDIKLKYNNNKFDDGVLISVNSGKGIISGINERSVLLAVYRFLTEAGCRFIRPGEDGEYIPKINIESLMVNVESNPSYRHRGLCIEGAVSYEHVKDIIDWCPKVGMNSYFIQFREAYTFFERWYKHKNNPTKEPEEFNMEIAKQYTAKLEEEIKKRGLIYHAVGHGWTCEPFGIPATGWDEGEYEISDKLKNYLAEIKGERNIWKGIPLNTNLCYSNSEVRKTIIEDIAKYIKEKNNIDLLHLWLADGYNNHCECKNCIKMRPSDFYIKLLNELDELLTKENINTKIVFLTYVDLFWAPEKEVINNQERFVFMFAPISRVYNDYFKPNPQEVVLPKYERNNIKLPTSIADNVGY